MRLTYYFLWKKNVEKGIFIKYYLNQKLIKFPSSADTSASRIIVQYVDIITTP